MSGIDIGMGFNLPSPTPIDDRVGFTTIEQMKNYPVSQLPDTYFCTNSEDGRLYIFNKNNSVSSITGKWRKVDTRDDLIFNNIVVLISQWVSDTTYNALGFLYKASIICLGANNTLTPNVVFSCTEAMSGNFAPICESITDGLYIYCKAIPVSNITIPEIRFIRGSE